MTQVIEKVGSEFLVNTQTANNQSEPTITSLAGGGFVVSWTDESRTAPDADATGIRAQVFDAAGARLGAEFVANTVTFSFQNEPTITGLAGGGFVISWPKIPPDPEGAERRPTCGRSRRPPENFGWTRQPGCAFGSPESCSRRWPRQRMLALKTLTGVRKPRRLRGTVGRRAGLKGSSKALPCPTKKPAAQRRCGRCGLGCARAYSSERIIRP